MPRTEQVSVTVAGVMTTGVDLGAQPARTAVAVIEWHPESAEITEMRVGVDDRAIVELAASSNRVGIDCAFGWPDEFVDYVRAHQRGAHPDPATRGIDGRRLLAYRETDRAVRTLTGRLPLSVSTDRLGLTAMRCADLLAAFADAGSVVDRSGTTGRLVEVYPAASLRLWGVDVAGYKTRPDDRRRAAANLRSAAPWLRLDAATAILLEQSDDALDATVAALTARAHTLNGTHRPPDAAIERARREGWIALPSRPLAELGPSQPRPAPYSSPNTLEGTPPS
jgi:hypothetical protein